MKYFKPDGSLQDNQPPFGDPYRRFSVPGSFAALHVDEDGYFDDKVVREAGEVVKLTTCEATSYAAMIHHATQFALGTADHYPTSSYWR